MGRIKPAALLRQSKRLKGPARPSLTGIAASGLFLVTVLLSIFYVARHRGNQQSSQYTVFNTTKGLLTLQLNRQLAPKAVESFVNHSQNGDYNGWIFHRVINGFMIQGGDQGSDETGGNSLRDVKFDDASGIGHMYDRFTLTLENLGPGTNGSRFFVTTVGGPHLNHNKHVVIGRVAGGQQVLNDMEDSPIDVTDQKKDRVVIINTLLRNSL